MATNPIVINIPANSLGMLSCLCNAGYYQRVTVQLPGSTVIFQGSGEGVPMLTPGGRSHVQMQPATTAYSITATFEYSTTGADGPFQLAQVQDLVQTGPSPFTIIQVTSEDSTDNDNNDSYLTVMLMTQQTLAGSTEPASPAPGTGVAKALELHAKTYYNDPDIKGGDEHYVTVPPFTGTMASVIYAGTSWQMLLGGCYNETTTFGGYLHIDLLLGKSSHFSMVGAQLCLATIAPYWGSVPSGHRSVDWEAELYESPWQVTEVTH